jgi:hypothetical protein
MKEIFERLHTYERSAIITELLAIRKRTGFLTLEDAPLAVKTGLHLNEDTLHPFRYYQALQYAFNFITTLEKE